MVGVRLERGGEKLERMVALVPVVLVRRKMITPEELDDAGQARDDEEGEDKCPDRTGQLLRRG